MVEPQKQNRPTDKVFLGGRPMPQPELQNSRNIISQEMIEGKIEAIKMEPENSQNSLKEILLYYLAFLYKVFDAKNASNSLPRTLERLRELRVCSRRELIALGNDDILKSKDFSWMLGIIYLRLAIPEFTDAPLEAREEERGEIIISHYLEEFGKKYDDPELKKLLGDLLKYNDDERLELEDLKERLEIIYATIFEPNRNPDEIIQRENNINPEPEPIQEPRIGTTILRDPIIPEEHPLTLIQRTPEQLQENRTPDIITREADFVILVIEENRDYQEAALEQAQNQVTPPPGPQVSAHTPEESFLRPPLEINSQTPTPTPNSQNPQSPSGLHPLFERLQVLVRVMSGSISTGNQTSSESSSFNLPLPLPPSRILDDFPNISQDNPRTNFEASLTSISTPDQSETPSIPGFAERFSFISRHYQDSLSSLEELRTLLESFESQPPPELLNHPRVPENNPLLPSLLTDETRTFLSQNPVFTELFAYLKHQGFTTKICDSDNADSSPNYFIQFDMNSTASGGGGETLYEFSSCSETPWMDSVGEESDFESFMKCKRGRVCNFVQ